MEPGYPRARPGELIQLLQIRPIAQARRRKMHVFCANDVRMGVLPVDVFFLHRLARVAQQGIDPFGVLAHAGISFGGQLIHRLPGNRGDHGRARVARAVHIQRVVKGLNLQRNARLRQAAGGPCQQEQDHHQPFRHECHEIAPPFPVQDRAGRLVLLRPCVTDSRCPSQRRQQRGDLDFTS